IVASKLTVCIRSASIHNINEINEKINLNFQKEPCSFSLCRLNLDLRDFSQTVVKYKKAAYLTGNDAIPPEALTQKGLDESQVYTLKEEYFIRNREKNKKIFEGPHVLIREIAGKNSIPVVFTDNALSFTKQIVGINAPVSDIDKLKEIEKRIKNNRAFLFHLACFSGRYMVSKATSVLKSDIDNLPYPENKDEFEFSGLEYHLINDVLDYMLEFRRKGETAPVMEPVSREQLSRFGETYCKLLNSVYKKFKPYPHIETDNFICFPIYFGEKPNLVTTDPLQFEKSLNRLVFKKMGRHLEISRVLRIYDQNIIYMVKPKQTRYWLCSVAIRDADETFEDLLKQGY
ncbi:MAG: hypothetical protein GY757_00790, partial [bacterium]|nr:hypothetical protein [bacterium]